MNIKQAKEQVKKTCVAYLTKDAFGEYVMPVETQRPIFLLGAPGIGKTAIMAQVAAELEFAWWRSALESLLAAERVPEWLTR